MKVHSEVSFTVARSGRRHACTPVGMGSYRPGRRTYLSRSAEKRLHNADVNTS